MAEEINNLKIEVAVINEKLDSQGKKIDTVIAMIDAHTREEAKRFEDFANTKADQKEVDDIRANLNRGVWIVLSAVIVAVLALVLK